MVWLLSDGKKDGANSFALYQTIGTISFPVGEQTKMGATNLI